MGWLEAAGLAALMVAAGGLVLGLALRSRNGTLGRNYVAGIRTKATLADDESWQAGQRAGWAWTAAGGAASILTGLAMLTRPSDAVGFAILLGGTAVLVAGVVMGAVKGDRAAKAVGVEAGAGAGG